MSKTFTVKLDDTEAPEPISEKTLEVSLQDALADHDIEVVEVKQTK